ncbi:MULTISPECIES: 30S ribosomal protein S4 [Alicyclobacillus]|uniref:Small ribosomal subunit protein uS4 n=1 Tax=Alicyclobacillus acidoterrestris (strain ATCC 49025 / DSM 3922 / CIP 106132 / NCIMB 13137 / GD3B) TaxID=1356854 RepID=T0BZP8_ALIAG|nr:MULTISPECIES: 30S ribosomal protein S4 [Alicyclobacillus]EPZ45885.1 30S ribosomal protein S4 [Alicyclobacillus acidoterrestris ATCC 49025]UNO49318.1 30S ribosomal protein S4 [Alicyclobacillus acidoterrestris]GEO26755.1 30S ribosomal protein S4 [Alicyclobacillus acidoterrestris]
MARYTGPVCRLCRREGIKLYLKGDRCFSEKCAIDKRPYAPGQHGQGRKRNSEYGQQLREKQKARRYYGVLESQFERYYEEASRRRGVTGENLLELLESRLDNVVYRLGMAASRKEARQLVRHGHFSVNGRRVDIPSYLVREGDVIAVREKSREAGRVKELIELLSSRTIPAWLELDAENLSGKVLRKPAREEIDTPVEEQMIIEHYSR